MLAALLLEQHGLVSLLEDDFELFEILTWGVFFLRTCRIYLQQGNVQNQSRNNEALNRNSSRSAFSVDWP
jgi:hypothetical protein